MNTTSPVAVSLMRKISIACLVILLAFLSCSKATDIPISGTLTSWPTFTGADTLVVTGGTAGTLELSDTTAGAFNFDYDNSISTRTNAAIGAATSGVGLRAVGGWAFMNSETDRFFLITQISTGTLTLNLDKIIFTGANGAGGNGGAIMANGAGSQDAWISITGDVIFKDNATGGGQGRGGAIFITNNSLKFSGNAIFDSNTAAGSAPLGGAIYMARAGTGTETPQVLHFEKNAVFMNNKSGGNGGAVSLGNRGKLVVDGTAFFISNTSAQNGGAIHLGNNANNGGTLVFNGPATFTDNDTSIDGGAVFVYRDLDLLSFSDTAVFSGNKSGVSTPAGAGRGGAINAGVSASGTVQFGAYTRFTGNQATSHGGAIAFNNTLKELRFDGAVIFENNIAGQARASGTAHGGGLYLGGTVESIIFSGSTRFSGNEATGFGGGIYGTGANTIVFANSVIFENNKSGLNTTLDSFGGGIALEGAANLSFNMLDGTEMRFEGNMTGKWGGAIYTRTGGDLTFSGSAASFSFLHNVVGGANGTTGGAIFVREKNIIVNDDVTAFVVRGNLAGHATRDINGGAFFATTGRIVLGGNVTFQNNQASGFGGALAVNSGAVHAGGVIAITGEADFSDNMAYKDGGAISYVGTAANIIRIATEQAGSGGISFTGNIAGLSGGAIYLGTESTGAGIELTAREADITFSGNKHGATVNRSVIDAEAVRSTGNSGYMTATGGTPNDIYLGGTNQTLTISADANRTVALRSGIANAITVTTTVTKTGSGAMIIGANSDIDATTTIQEGSFLLENDATYGRSASTGTLAAQAGVTLGGSGTIQANDITLANNTILHATGTLVFNSANAITGNNVILTGAGLINGLASITTTKITIGDGAHATGQQLSFGASALTLDSGTLNMSLFGGTDSDTLLGGTIDLGSGTTTLNYNEFLSGTYTLIATTGGLTNTGSYATTVNGVVVANSRWQTTYAILGSNTLQAILDKGGSEQLTWNTTDGAWDFSTANWTGADGFLDGDAVAFNAITGTINIPSGRLSPSQMDVTGSGTTTFAGAGGITTDKTKWDATDGPAPATVLGQLNKTGVGTLVFKNTGTNEFTGGILLAGGAIQFDSADQLRTTGTAIEFAAASSGTLRPDADGLRLSNTLAIGAASRAALDVQSGSFFFDGRLSGNSGTFAKTGDGTMILAHDNSTYTGASSIEAGTFILQDKLGGALTLQSNARLIATGSVVIGSLTANAGSILQVGGSGGAVETLSITGALTLDGATLLYDLVPVGTPPTSAQIDKITATALALSGTNTFDFTNDLVSGTHHLIYTTPAGISGFDEDNFITKVGGNLYSASRTGVFYNIISGSTLDMVVSVVNATQTWKGADDGVWRSGTATANWTGADSYFNAGDSVIFDDTVLNDRRTVEVQAAGVVVAEMLINSAQDYTFIGGQIRGTDDPSESTGIGAPTGKLIKKGAGTLTLSNSSNVFAGGIWLEAGRLQGNALSFGTNTITANASTGIVFDQAVSGTYKGVITGTSATTRGDVLKINTGTLTISGTVNAINFTQQAGDVELATNGSLNVSQYNLNSGAFKLTGADFTAAAFNIGTSGTFAHTGTLTLSPGGVLANAGLIKIGKAAGATSAGALTITGDYRGDNGIVELHTLFNEGGAATSTDQLIIRGDASGHTLLHIKNIGGAGGATGHGTTDGIQIVVIDGNNTGTFEAVNADTGGSRFVVGGFDYALITGSGGMFFQSTAFSPEIPAMCALPAIASIVGQTTLDTVQQRMGEIRFAPEYNHGSWWLRDAYNNTQLKTDLFAGTRFHTNAAQVGIDFTRIGNINWSVGAFVTHVDVSGKIGDNSTRITNSANGGGVYAHMQHGGLYAALTVKAEDNQYDIFAHESTLRAKGASIGAALETGYAWKTNKWGVLEPQFQLGYQNYNIKPGDDIFQRGYDFDNPDSLIARAGLLWRGTFKFSDGSWAQPWIRAGASHEFLNRYDMRVLDAASEAQTFSNNMRGGQFLADIGLTWGITSQFAFNFAGSYNTGDRYKGYTISAGARFIW